MAKNKEFEFDLGFDYFCFSINSELGILNQGITSSCTCRLNSILLKSYYLFLQSIKANLWQFNVSEPSISLIFTLTFKCTFLGLTRGGDPRCIMYMESFLIIANNVLIYQFNYKFKSRRH